MDSDILNPSGINNETAVKGTPKIISSVSEFLVSNKSLESSDMVFGLQDLLGDRYIDYISQHNTPCDIVVFGDDDGKYVVKLERNENPITTQKEVEWYQYIKDHGVVPAHFPKYYGGYQDEGLAFYFLEYLDEYRSVGSLFLDDKLSNEELVKASTDAITTIEEMFHALPRKKDPEVAKKVFADRLQSRIAEMYKYPYLKEMLEREEIVINGKAYKNIPYYMEKLVNHPLLSEIAEKEVGIIHGDMHFGNILLGGDDRPFMFLDPNGALYLPLEYDYSKILYATHTGYDFLHMGRYQLSGGDGVYEFKLYEEEKRRAVTQGYIKFLGDRSKTVYYTNAIHTLASLPHHAKDVEEETATYLQSLIILDELFREDV